MYDTFSDELGLLDFQRSEHGSGMSQRSQAKRLVAELGRVSQHQGSTMFTVQQMKDIAKVRLPRRGGGGGGGGATHAKYH